MLKKCDKPPRPNSGEPEKNRKAGDAGAGSYSDTPELGRGASVASRSVSMECGLLQFDWDAPLTEEARDQMVNKIADAVGKWRMEVPAILFLESGGPLSPLAGQGLVAFSPFVAPLMPHGLSDVQKLSKFLEQPENVRRLVDMLGDKLADRERKKEPDAARK